MSEEAVPDEPTPISKETQADPIRGQDTRRALLEPRRQTLERSTLPPPRSSGFPSEEQGSPPRERGPGCPPVAYCPWPSGRHPENGQ